MARGRKRPLTPVDAPEQAVERILATRSSEGVVYFPVKHFSPACAWQVRRLILRERPAAVLVEGPEDADALIAHILDEATEPPISILSSFVDQKNRYGQNGVLSAAADVPARYRGWWPMTCYAPEYQALKAGAEVGAELGFIDVPLPCTIPHDHVRRGRSGRVLDDHHLATSAFFEALAARQRMRSFDELWHACFEVGGWRLDPDAFMRLVLVFAYCARHVGADDKALELDGTLLREAHMRHAIDAVKRRLPGGLVVVVTGAYHSVALPETKPRRAKIRRERDLTTLLTAHSYPALASLYGLNRLPGYGDAVWSELCAAGDGAEPFNQAALRLLLEVMRVGRGRNEGVSTADAVGAYRAARNLAALRRNAEITREDLLDAAQLGYIKGDARIRGGGVEAACREVLTGQRQGRVTPNAGQPPLLCDYYAQCRAHKIDVSGASQVVRCDVHKQPRHRLKSALLHQCSFLGVPMFGELERLPWGAEVKHFRGPDPVGGHDLHLIGETWAIAWREAVDARLVDLSDLGASVAAAAAAMLTERSHAATGDAAETTRLCLRAAQMMLLDTFDDLLGAVEEAIAVDASFAGLVDALADFVVLHGYRDALATEGRGRLVDTVQMLFHRATSLLPGIAGANQAEAPELLERLQTLVRVTLTFDAVPLDRALLVERLREMVAGDDGTPVLRGAGFGVLYSFGATREKVIAAELDGYLLGSTERARMAGPFLDGLFMTGKSIFMSSARLLRAVNAVLAELSWSSFKALLPDLRRAFMQFIPREIDRIAERVSQEIGLVQRPADDGPVPPRLAAAAAHADARVAAALAAYL